MFFPYEPEKVAEAGAHFDQVVARILAEDFAVRQAPEARVCHDHFSRNPRIARVLAEMRYIKDIGEGVDRMYHEMGAAGLPPPEWIEEPAAVRLILRNGIEQRRLATPEEMRTRTMAELNDRQRRALGYVRERGSISNREYRRAFGVSNKTAYQDLKALVELEMLQKVGHGKQTRYVLPSRET